jgi:SulP family sulfate permease
MSSLEKTHTNMAKYEPNHIVELVVPKKKNIKNDVLSGLTVALALVPEAIAFSFVAGVEPRVGLYAAFMMGLITAIFGGRPGMISGATGAVAVIFAPLVYAHGVSYLFAAVTLMGVLQIGFGLLKLGKFIRLIPHPVMLGFVNGLAIIIFKAQFSQFYVGSGENRHLLETQPMLIMLGLIGMTMLISIVLPKITKAIPATLVAIVTVTLLGVFLRNSGYEVRNVLDYVLDNDKSGTITTIAAGLPKFHFFDVPMTFKTLEIIFPYAVLAATVGLIESLMTLTLIDELTETRGRGNKECMGQGLANFVNGFFGGMGGCAMIGQSMINIRAGGRTKISGITAAISLLLFILFGAKMIELIPLAALVGVMFMVVIGTFEWSSLRLIKKVPMADFLIIVLVSSVTVFFDLAIAVIAGVIASAVIFAWEHGKNISANIKSNDEQKIYKLNGPLFFGSVSSFKELFDFKNDPNEVFIDFKNSRVCDHSGIEALNNITERYAQNNKKLHLLNLSKECSTLISKMENVVEISVIEDLEWHIADDLLA